MGYSGFGGACTHCKTHTGQNWWWQHTGDTMQQRPPARSAAGVGRPSGSGTSSPRSQPPAPGSSVGYAGLASPGQRSCAFKENDPATPGYLLCTGTRAVTAEPARKRLVFSQKPFAVGCPVLRASKGTAGASCICTFILYKFCFFCRISAAHFLNDLIRG